MSTFLINLAIQKADHSAPDSVWFIPTVSSVFTQQRALLHWPTAARWGSDRGKFICPILNEWKVAQRRRRGVWMDGTDRVGDKVIMPNRQQLPRPGLVRQISDQLCRTSSSSFLTNLLFWKSRLLGREVDLSEWPVPAEALCLTDNKWERSDHNKRHKVRPGSFSDKHKHWEQIWYPAQIETTW